MDDRTLYLTIIRGREYQLIVDFDNAGDYFAWDGLVRNLKSESDRINAEREDGTPEAALKLMAIQWLLLAKKLKDDFGAKRVPLDIRTAVHDYQEFVGQEETDFGLDHGAFTNRSFDQ